jgi:hypothetical protein
MNAKEWLALFYTIDMIHTMEDNAYYGDITEIRGVPAESIRRSRAWDREVSEIL